MNKENINSDEIRKHLLTAPDRELDLIAKEDIQKWSSPVKSLELLHTLDICCRGSLCGDFAMKVMHILFDEACDRENVSRQEVEKLAIWRHN